MQVHIKLAPCAHLIFYDLLIDVGLNYSNTEVSVSWINTLSTEWVYNKFRVLRGWITLFDKISNNDSDNNLGSALVSPSQSLLPLKIYQNALLVLSVVIWLI